MEINTLPAPARFADAYQTLTGTTGLWARSWWMTGRHGDPLAA
jgi:hypothetical protein